MKTGDTIVWSSMFPRPFFSGLIKVFTGQATHVSLVVGDDLIIEAMEEGVVLNSLSDRLHSSCNVWLLPLDRKINEGSLIEYCYKQLGKDYDLRQAIRSGRPLVDNVCDDSKLFCSELVAFAYQAVGLIDTNPSAFTPTDVVNLPFFGKTVQLKGKRRLRRGR